MMSPELALRGWLRGAEHERGRKWQRILADSYGPDATRRRAFERTFKSVPGDGRVRLGRWRRPDGSFGWCGIPLQDAMGLRAWITGTSGGGKTYEAIAILLQLLEHRHVLWVFDFKGELADLLTHTVLPAIASRPEGRWLLGRVHVIDLFGNRPPALRITEPEPGVPRHVQALTLSATLQEVLNAEHGLRMERVFLMASCLAIELRQPLTTLSRWFRNPDLFAQAAASSTDPLIRDYAVNVFPKEPRASLHALSSRLDLLFFLPEIRRALEAPACVSFADLCREGVFIFRVGGAPAGSEGVEAAVGSLLIGRATRAIMSRSVDEDTLPLLLLIDEGQRAIRQRDVGHLERVLTQARFKRSSLIFCNQQTAQLDPAFVQLLRTNTSMEFIFRANPEDADRLAKHLPMSLTSNATGDTFREVSRVISHLPNREFVLWSKQLGQAERMRSPRVDMAALERMVARTPSELRARVFATARDTGRPTTSSGVSAIEPVRRPFLFGDEPGTDDALSVLG